jgi:hypothetical protein
VTPTFIRERSIVQQVEEMLTLLAGRGGLLKDKFKVREGKAQDALVI